MSPAIPTTLSSPAAASHLPFPIDMGEGLGVRVFRPGTREVGGGQGGESNVDYPDSPSHVPAMGGETPTALGPGVMINTREGPSPVFSA